MSTSYIENKKELSDNLRFIRECRNLTQQKIADELEIDRSTYAYYENGITEPNVFKIIRLAEIFNVEFTDLITKTGPMKARLKMKVDLKLEPKIVMGNYLKNKKTLSKKLKIIRKNLKLTQQSIAEEIGLDRSTYCYYESGKVMPKIFTIIKIACVFDIKVNDFMLAE